MSQGPRTRVRLDGQVYRVIRDGQGTRVQQRTSPGKFETVYNSRTVREPPPSIARIIRRADSSLSWITDDAL